jgi:hypothetical protein
VDEKLRKEEAETQLMAMREQQKLIDRSKIDVLNRENMEVKMLEKEVGEKDAKISELKN